MKKKLRIISLLLTLALTMGAFDVLAVEDELLPEPQAVQQETPDENEIVRAIVLFEGDGAAMVTETPGDGLFAAEQEALEETQTELVDALQEAAPTLEVAHEFTVFFSGVSVDVPYGDLEALEEVDGVADVWVTTVYEIPETEEVTGDGFYALGDTTLTDGYTGQGTLIAVLDTGINLNHEAFGVYAGALGDTALSSTESQNANTSVPGRYVSEKVPFAYDYGDMDDNVTDVHGHGTHVAAIAAGYAPEGTEQFSGAAPGAQLAILKIFKNGSTKTTTDVYFAALEDAYILGADVISMSLGTPCGFTHDANLDGALFGDIYERLDEAGIILCAAAGNHGSQADYSTTSNGTVLAGYADYGTVASPSSYYGNTSVAAATNYEQLSYAISLGGTYYGYSEPSGQGGAMAASLGGAYREYVMVQGEGSEAQFSQANVSGKIAVVSRGGLSFQDKVKNAANAGAIGLIIYNDQTQSVTMVCPNPAIPVVLVSKNTGELLKNAEKKEVYISASKQRVMGEEPLTITAYSAWGTTPDLTIAPAVAGVGDNVYSANYGNDTGYRYSSGTSMATPYVAGHFAVILSYLKEVRGDLTKLQRAEMAEDLAYSGAKILGTEETLISVRQQGSGLIDAAAAVKTGAYLEEPLQELGDDPDETGVYTVELAVSSLQDGCPSLAFYDLETDSYYHEAVDYSLRAGLFYGMGNGAFEPELSLTRGQMVTVLYRMAGSPAVTGKSSFTDVKAGAYYEIPVIWAQQNGVTNGVTNTTFEPNSPVTRQQLVTMLHRYLGSPEESMDLGGYADIQKVDGYALPAFRWAVKNGIINSYSTAQLELCPFGEATRAQYATILYRYLKASGQVDGYDLSAVVMADTAVLQSDGTATNLMTMQELDCDVEFSCGSRLELDPCSGEAEITATVRLSEAAKSMLRENFEDGTYVEGYITLQGETDIHATFLSFFGDWEAGSILEEVDFRDVMEARDLIREQELRVSEYDLVPVNMGANMAQIYCRDKGYQQYLTLGDNLLGTVDYRESHSAVSGGDAACGRTLMVQTMQLRNARTITLTVTDAESRKIYYTERKAYRSKSRYTEGSGWQYSNTFSWDVPNNIASGTEVIVSVSASLHGEPEREQWSFPVMVDSTAPTVTYQRTGDTLKITATDDQYLAGMTVYGSDGTELLKKIYSDTTAGKSHTVEVTAQSGSVKVVAMDYATNVREITVSG